MRESLPPGPRAPQAVQTLHWWVRPTAFFERCRDRYGRRFTVRLLVTPPFVHLSDPDEIREVFLAPPDVLHPGEGASALQPIVGRHSLILLDEDPHLSQRRLMLPAFHGDAIAGLRALVGEIAVQEVESWPRDVPVPLHPRLQALTLEVIMRAVFGLEEGERLDALRSKLDAILDLGARPFALVPALRVLPEARLFERVKREADEVIYALIDERRAEHADRDDILSLLLQARHEDGSPMSDEELRDELMTLLVAGHETTASELAWGFHALTRQPRVLREVTRAVDDGDDAYLTATVNEILRRHPVLPNAEPRLTKRPVEIGGVEYPEGVVLGVNAYLVHHDPTVYPDPYAFRPERFLDQKPGTYTFLPFGGGRRRCIGASFAVLEMESVLRAVLERCTPVAGGAAVEGARRRSITMSPRHGAVTTLHDRVRVREPVAA
jgi:cytochrome P450